MVFFFVVLVLSLERSLCCFALAIVKPSALSRQVVRRIDQQDFSPNLHYRHSINDEFPETPVLVTGVFTQEECQNMCDTVMSCSNDLQVNVQRKRKKSPSSSERTTTDIYPCTLQQGIDAIMESSHDDARLIFEEGLLERQQDKPSLQQVSRLLNARQEALFNDEDWLQHFPLAVKPSSCVVIAGEGATSTLHRDPLEWTGTSVCLEGTKVWRFIPPSPNVTAVDDMLHSYRLDSIAWEEDDNHDSIPISAGWQSDFNLYDKKRVDDESIPSARDFDQMSSLAKKWKQMEDIASDVSKLQPSTLPLQQGAILWTAVQRPGDLLLIPAHWWHQTYALEPSISIASQRCGTVRDAPRLIHHVLETTGLVHDAEFCKDLLQESYDKDGVSNSESPRDIVDKLFAKVVALSQ